MSGSTTKRVFRFMLAWNDEKEQAWLEQQAREGWHVRTVRGYGYTLEKGPAAEVAYRLDVTPAARSDREEYLGLFRDAGWEHVGRRGLFHVFRKPVVPGETMEIHTDPQSRVAAYQRVVAFAGLMVVAMMLQLSATLLNGRTARPLDVVILGMQVLLVACFSYGTVRMLLLISRVRNTQPHRRT
jgi:hypothetical protein